MTSNALQSVVNDISIGNDLVYVDLLRELKRGTSINDAFKLAGYNNRVKGNFANGILSSMESATLGTVVQLDEDKAVHWYMNTKHVGGALSDTLRGSGAKEAIRAELSVLGQFRTSVSSLQKSLPVSQNGRLPAEVRRMLALYSESGGKTAGVSRAVLSVRNYVIRHGQGAHGTTELAKKYITLADAVDRDNPLLVSRAYDTAVKQKIKYINERIARTEVARSYGMTTKRAYMADPSVIGARWLLSPMHPAPDVCDYCAEADTYGLGAGVYPVSATPMLPAHPNCLCMLEPVKRRANTPTAKYSQASATRAADKIRGEMKYPNTLNRQIENSRTLVRDTIPASVIRMAEH